MSESLKVLSAVQQRQYQDEGYCILERALSDDFLQILRDECARFIAIMDAEMDEKGTDTLGISHRNNRYFISNRWKQSEHLGDVLFSELMAGICRDTLGPNAFLFHEQYVVKAAEKGMKFSWHQDSGYVGHPHTPYLSCWCALDDVDESNGTIYVLPYSHAGTRDWVPHTEQEAGSNDLVGYRGDDPGVPVIVPAGSIVCFSSTVFHRSGPNTSDTMRRVYLPQYSPEVIMRPDGSTPWALSDPILRDGLRVPYVGPVAA